MATITPTQIFRAQQVGSAATTLYTVPANSSMRISKMTFANPTGTARNISVYLLNPSQPVDDSTALVKSRTLAPGETYECYPAEGHILPSNSTIQAVADQSGSIVAQGSALLIQ
jgi:hypothetical protein